MVKSDSDLSGREKGFPNGSAYTKELSEKDELCSKMRREVFKTPSSKASVFELQGAVGVFCLSKPLSFTGTNWFYYDFNSFFLII